MKTELIKYKKLNFFYLSAAAVLGSGILLSLNPLSIQSFVLIWCCLNGVFAIYRLNDFIDSEHNLKNNLTLFFKDKLHLLFVIQFIFFTIPLALYFIPSSTFYVLGFCGIIGALYSLKFKINNYQFRIKNIFLLKNISIGFCWAALVIIGSGQWNKIVLPIFFLFFIQVFIGSVLRDIPDIKKDKLNLVQTLPLTVGINTTYILLHILNWSTLFLYFIIQPKFNFLILIIFVLLWRSFTMLLAKKKENKSFWNQEANLFTCILTFLIILILNYGS